MALIKKIFSKLQSITEHKDYKRTIAVLSKFRKTELLLLWIAGGVGLAVFIPILIQFSLPNKGFISGPEITGWFNILNGAIYKLEEIDFQQADSYNILSWMLATQITILGVLFPLMFSSLSRDLENSELREAYLWHSRSKSLVNLGIFIIIFLLISLAINWIFQTSRLIFTNSYQLYWQAFSQIALGLLLSICNIWNLGFFFITSLRARNRQTLLEIYNDYLKEEKLANLSIKPEISFLAILETVTDALRINISEDNLYKTEKNIREFEELSKLLFNISHEKLGRDFKKATNILMNDVIQQAGKLTFDVIQRIEESHKFLHLIQTLLALHKNIIDYPLAIETFSDGDLIKKYLSTFITIHNQLFLDSKKNLNPIDYDYFLEIFENFWMKILLNLQSYYAKIINLENIEIWEKLTSTWNILSEHLFHTLALTNKENSSKKFKNVWWQQTLPDWPLKPFEEFYETKFPVVEFSNILSSDILNLSWQQIGKTFFREKVINNSFAVSVFRETISNFYYDLKIIFLLHMVNFHFSKPDIAINIFLPKFDLFRFLQNHDASLLESFLRIMIPNNIIKSREYENLLGRFEDDIHPPRVDGRNAHPSNKLALFVAASYQSWVCLLLMAINRPETEFQKIFQDKICEHLKYREQFSIQNNLLNSLKSLLTNLEALASTKVQTLQMILGTQYHQNYPLLQRSLNKLIEHFGNSEILK